MSSTEYNRLGRLNKNVFKYNCTRCKDKNISDHILWEELLFQNVSLDETLDENNIPINNIPTNNENDLWNVFRNRGLHLLHININSILPKIDELREKLDKTVLDGEIAIDGYQLIRADRNRSGGGVACYMKSNFGVDIRKDFSDDIENIFFDILIPNSKPILVGIVYRPPDQSGFLDKLSNAINNTTNFDSQEVYILGDFNINLINTKTSTTNGIRQYKQFCSLHGLKQLILNPTHITENTSTLLDHVLTNSHDKVSQSGVINVGISDHQLTYCTRKISRTKSNEHKYITIRSLKNYTKDIFIAALNSINFPDYSKYGNVDESYEDLTKKISEVIDNIAPLKKIRVRNNTQEWYDDEIRQAIKKRDKFFAIFKNTKLCDDNVRYKKARNHVQSMIKRKKRQFYVDKLKDNVGKPKELWKTLKSLGLSSKANLASKICLEKNNVKNPMQKHLKDFTPT